MTTEDRQAQTVRALMGAFGDGIEETVAAFREHCTPDVEWVNPGYPTTRGADEVRDLLLEFNRTMGMAATRIDVLHLASTPGVVLSERIDHSVDADGKILISFHIVGVFEFDGDRVSAWREYTNADELQALQALDASAS